MNKWEVQELILDSKGRCGTSGYDYRQLNSPRTTGYSQVVSQSIWNTSRH